MKKMQEHENRGCCSLLHRTTMECAEKQLFATGNIVVRFPASYYDGMWTTLREKTSFHSKNPIFNHRNPKFELQKGLQVQCTAQHPKQHRNMQSTTQFTTFGNFFITF